MLQITHLRYLYHACRYTGNTVGLVVHVGRAVIAVLLVLKIRHVWLAHYRGYDVSSWAANQGSAGPLATKAPDQLLVVTCRGVAGWSPSCHPAPLSGNATCIEQLRVTAVSDWLQPAMSSGGHIFRIAILYCLSGRRCSTITGRERGEGSADKHIHPQYSQTSTYIHNIPSLCSRPASG